MTRASVENNTGERRARAEAAAWIARLHGPERTRATEHGLRRWLAEDPRHAKEFERATDAWNDTGALPWRPPREHMFRRASLTRRRTVWRTAVAVAAAGIIAVWMGRGMNRADVATGIGEQKIVELPDGSRVTLDTDSRIRVRYGPHVRSVSLRYGEAFFQVLHHPRWPFVVLAGSHKVIDVGTSFVVRRGRKRTGSLTVTVIRGQVAVTPRGLPNSVPSSGPDVVLVGAGKRLQLHAHAQPLLQTEPPQQAIAWLRGELMFNDTPLDSAVRKFNRYNRRKLVLSTPRLNRIHVGGVFRINAAGSFARAVADAHDLCVIVHHAEWILEPRNRPDCALNRRAP